MAVSKLFLKPVTRAFPPSVPNYKILFRPGFSVFSVLVNMDYVSAVFFS